MQFFIHSLSAPSGFPVLFFRLTRIKNRVIAEYRKNRFLSLRFLSLQIQSGTMKQKPNYSAAAAASKSARAKGGE